MKSIYSRDGYYQNQNPNTFLIKVLDVVNNTGKALDLGGGNGINSLYLKKKGWDVICIDLDETAISLCKQSGLEALQMDISNPQVFKKAPFNLILCLYVYQHLNINKQLITTRRIWDNLSYNGWFIGGFFLDDRPILPPNIIFPPKRAIVKYKYLWEKEDTSHSKKHKHLGIIVAAQKKEFNNEF